MLRLFAIPLLTLVTVFFYARFDQRPEFESIKEISETAYPEHLTGAFTGGFGEETCRSCHFDYDLNPKGGSLSLSGIPQKVSERESIDIQITVEREALGAAGFQLSARYPDGSQAGRFNIKGERVMFSRAVPDSLEYVQHSYEGTAPNEENKNSWAVSWKAPESIEGPVIFNIAGNAANGDQSEFGDFIYTKSVEVNP